MAGGGSDYHMNETELRAAFIKAAATGADTLIHVSRVDLDLSTSLMCMMDCFGRIEQTLTVNGQDPASINAAANFFHGDTPFIIGAYDLNKPFAEAQISPDALPAPLQYAIRDTVFSKYLSEMSWLNRITYLTQNAREAAKARVKLPFQPQNCN